jgi:8-amino-7-oxononanoate synthase
MISSMPPAMTLSETEQSAKTAARGRLPVQRATATTVTMGGREVLAFGGCNYLGLAFHPEVVRAAIDAFRDYGLSTSASRETTGNTTAHDDLESALAEFVGAAVVTVLPDGYSANLAAAEGLAVTHQLALVDAQCHTSIFEAATGAGMEVVRFEHLDPNAAAAVARAYPDKRIAIFTDGVFAADGALANARGLLAALPPNGTLVIDDCHGFCVMGEGGRGTISHWGVENDPRLCMTSSLAKGLGCHGGMVAGSRQLAEHIRTRSPAYICTTPAGPPIVRAALRSLEVLRREPERVERLHDVARRLDAGLRALGLQPVAAPTPVFAFTLGDNARMRAVHEGLLEDGFLAPLITYPGGPADLYFRLAVNAEHGAEDVDALLGAMAARLGA